MNNERFCRPKTVLKNAVNCIAGDRDEADYEADHEVKRPWKVGVLAIKRGSQLISSTKKLKYGHITTNRIDNGLYITENTCDRIE